MDWLRSHKPELIAGGLVAALFALPVLLLLWATSVPGTSFAGALPPLTTPEKSLSDTLRRHVTAIASTPHNVEHPQALEAAAMHIETELTAMGYKVERQPFFDGDKPVRNIEAVLAPADPKAPTLVIGAHYDSFGDVPGANDNGSGTAAVLELARALADRAGKSKLRIRFVLFANEEPPNFKTARMGSLVYAERLAKSRARVIGMMSLETMGSFSDARESQHYPFPLSLLYPDTGNFIAFVGMTSSRSFVRKSIGAFRAVAAIPSEGGSAPGFIQGIDWSDHWSFAQYDIPALMITDTAPFRYRHYRAPTDTPDRIDYDRLARVVSGLEKVVRGWSDQEWKP